MRVRAQDDRIWHRYPDGKGMNLYGHLLMIVRLECIARGVQSLRSPDAVDIPVPASAIPAPLMISAKYSSSFDASPCFDMSGIDGVACLLSCVVPLINCWCRPASPGGADEGSVQSFAVTVVCLAQGAPAHLPMFCD